MAVLWSGGHGYGLSTLVAPSPMQMVSADYITSQGDIFGHGVLRNGDQRVFRLIPNPRVPLPPATTPARPLPATTGPPDRSISIVLALHGANRGFTSVPTGGHRVPPERGGCGPRPVLARSHLDRLRLHPKIKPSSSSVTAGSDREGNRYHARGKRRSIDRDA
jgi:hypothetical protein